MSFNYSAVFAQALFPFTSDKKDGFINKEGKETVSATYERADPFPTSP